VEGLELHITHAAFSQLLPGGVPPPGDTLPYMPNPSIVNIPNSSVSHILKEKLKTQDHSTS